jgi:gliding motility-associated lipoprotein GldD
MKRFRAGPVVSYQLSVVRRAIELPAALGFVFLIVLASGCSDDAIPKPRGYFRIDLPVDSTNTVASNCPFTAEVPVYAHLMKGAGTGDGDGTVCWTDLLFPGQRAAVHMTWRSVHGDLPELINDAHEFKAKHESMATRIRAEEVLRDSARVFGTIFDVDGNVASPMVFYLTDSTSNFLYGALYFDVRPNSDSLAPVTERIRADIRRFAHTLHWGGQAGVVKDVQQSGK